MKRGIKWKKLALLLVLPLVVVSCQKQNSKQKHKLTLPPNFEVRYEADGISTLYIRVENQAYVEFKKDNITRPFFLNEEEGLGFQDNDNIFQDYQTYRFINNEWFIASSWSENINYYSLFESGSWYPFQNEKVYGVFHYLGHGVNLLNQQGLKFKEKSEDRLLVKNKEITCLVYEEVVSNKVEQGGVSIINKIWLEKNSLLLFKHVQIIKEGSLEEESLIFKVTSYETARNLVVLPDTSFLD